MSLFGKNKCQKAKEALKSQFGIDLYESGHYECDKWLEYSISISEKYDFVAVINRKEHGKFVAKEWYLYDKSSGWVKKASMDKRQSINLYAETMPYNMETVLEKYGNRLPQKEEEHYACIICDEYLSSYMTKHYFGFSIKVNSDFFWGKGTSHTQAIYMPHRDPNPNSETPEEYAARTAKSDSLIDELVRDILCEKAEK